MRFPSSGEHTRLACGLQRPAATNFQCATRIRNPGEHPFHAKAKFVAAERRDQHAGRARSPNPKALFWNLRKPELICRLLATANQG